MTRQVFFRVLMSLLLLFSQQMATSHALTHVTGSVETLAMAPVASDAEKSRTAAQDQSCNKCLVFAQCGAPLGAHALSYALPEVASLPVDGATIAATHARTILAFQSRAPPQA
ncbi:MAG: hypothetical protein WKG03_09355 [Telluria sp.]